MTVLEIWDYADSEKARGISIGGYSFYFSYKTIVAFGKGEGLKICENIWTQTTGKHLNAINAEKSIRLKHAEFEKQLNACLMEIKIKLNIPIQEEIKEYEKGE